MNKEKKNHLVATISVVVATASLLYARFMKKKAYVEREELTTECFDATFAIGVAKDGIQYVEELLETVDEKFDEFRVNHPNITDEISDDIKDIYLAFKGAMYEVKSIDEKLTEDHQEAVQNLMKH